ncbi:MAG: ABC-type nitrate/sulfonate/bicarbonate transport system, periplasmic component [Polaromonas sp.]|jgi:NitT/TauT family transport system substrate-binding protein|nr:ABC-type nitrate/sulfonate/bicarbonate transport system, periplasmic component [Polaromonas sp.]MDB5843416.1 ABC-type nitrate/sulfonate/bicarbonate transport system, periplasmic component [Polaromonas sp.]MDB5940225.1 ABC-type nitrate/sulfonate/bicarbonate transport system, periplasmic component [Polaromonas sp.]
MNLSRRFLVGAAMAVPLLATTAVARAEESVTVRLRWVTQTQFAGVYVALEKGFYKEAGLNVKINPGGPNVSTETLVASGADTFAVAGGTDSMLFSREKKLPVVAIAMTLQTTPYAFVSLQSSTIKSPKDFTGKTASAWFTGSQYQLYTSLQNSGIDPKSVNIVAQPFSMQPFIDGKYDVSTVTLYNEMLVLKDKNIPVNVFRADENGVRGQDNAIITSEKMIQQKPEVVQAFLNATLRGWKYAIQNQAEAVDIVVKSGSGLNKAHQTNMLAAYAQLMVSGTGRSQGLGWVDVDAAKKVNENLVKYTALQAPVDVAPAFTNQFWDKVPAEYKRP